MNLPPKVRFAIYVITGLAAILVTYLSAVGTVGKEATIAFNATVVFVAGLAGYNVKK